MVCFLTHSFIHDQDFIVPCFRYLTKSLVTTIKQMQTLPKAISSPVGETDIKQTTPEYLLQV